MPDSLAGTASEDHSGAESAEPRSCRARRAALRAIALDGKPLRGSGATGFTQVTLLAAMDHATDAILAQRQIGGRTNEILEARALLGSMDIAGSVIRMDALHTQRETARYLREHDAHYVFTVKANQLALLAACHRCITVDAHASGQHYESERTRGTIRERHQTTAGAEGIDFPGARQIARIIRHTRRPGAAGRLTKEVVYVINSLPPN